MKIDLSNMPALKTISSSCKNFKSISTFKSL
jgi:hypothetical protein